MYRHSLVVEILSARPKETTPTPIAELRVVIYSRLPYPRFKIRKILIDEISHLAWVFYSIRISIAMRKATCEISPSSSYPIELPYSKKMMIISGFEFNVKIIEDEAVEHIASSVFPIFNFLSNPKLYIDSVRATLSKFMSYPIYHAIFYDVYGRVKEEYNDWRIRNEVAPQSSGFTRSEYARGIPELSDFERWKKIFLESCGF